LDNSDQVHDGGWWSSPKHEAVAWIDSIRAVVAIAVAIINVYIGIIESASVTVELAEFFQDRIDGNARKIGRSQPNSLCIVTVGTMGLVGGLNFRLN
jgi:hypothetical protein